MDLLAMRRYIGIVLVLLVVGYAATHNPSSLSSEQAPGSENQGRTKPTEPVRQTLVTGERGITSVNAPGCRTQADAENLLKFFVAKDTESLFECAISRIYADSAGSVLSLGQALACKTGRPLLARPLWARLRQPRRQSFSGKLLEFLTQTGS